MELHSVRGGRNRAARWGAIVAAALVFTLAQVQFSRTRGRLVVPPMYDDVSYFNDAASRLDAVYTRGLPELWRGYWHGPPHSPYSTLMAMGAYSIFGVVDWAPYVMNVLLIVALLWSTDYFMRGGRVWERGLAWLFVLSAPVANIMVTECRPDPAWGLAAAVAVILPFLRPFVGGSFRYQLAIGGWLAAALLIKPSIFPLTLLSGAMAWSLATICDRITRPQEFSWGKAVQAWVVCSIPVLLFAVPHYLINREEIINYTFSVSIGSARKNAILPGQYNKYLYFLTGMSGKYMLATHFVISLAVIGFGALALAVRANSDAQSRARLLRAGCLGFITFVAYLVPTLVGLGNPFFGAEFHVLLVLGAVVVMGMFIRHAAEWGIVGVRPVPVLAAACVALVTSRFFPPADSFTPLARDYNAVIRQVSDLLFEKVPVQSRVFVTSTGWINADTLIYLARQKGKMFDVSDQAFSDDVTDQAANFDKADFVLAGESGVGEFNQWIPASKILDQTLAAIRARPDFRQIGSVRSESGRWIYLFGHTPKFQGFDDARNISQVEGPYPDWHLPLVRWSYYPEASVHFTAPVPGTYRLSMDGRAPNPGQVITVTVDGREVGRHAFKAPMHFETDDFSFQVLSGEHELALHFVVFSQCPWDEARKWAVLFQRLQLLPPTATPTTQPAEKQ